MEDQLTQLRQHIEDQDPQAAKRLLQAYAGDPIFLLRAGELLVELLQLEQEVPVGVGVRAARERAGISQDALAVCAGLSLKTIKNLEAGASQPNVHTLNKLARVPEIEEAVGPVLRAHLRAQVAAAGMQLRVIRGGAGGGLPC